MSIKVKQRVSNKLLHILIPNTLQIVYVGPISRHKEHAYGGNGVSISPMFMLSVYIGDLASQN